MNPPRSWSGPKPTSAVTSRLWGVPPALAIPPENAMAKQDACAAAISSSGLGLPAAPSGGRFGHDTSKVPRPELARSVRPDPSCRVPFHAVRAVRVAIVHSLRTGRRPLLDSASNGPYPPRSCTTVLGGGGDRADPLGQQAELGLQVVELAGVEADRADHLLGDGERLLAQRAALVGERDRDRPLVLDAAMAGDQACGREPLEQRGERAAVESEAGTELPHRLVVAFPEQHHDQVLRIREPDDVEHRPVAGSHRTGGGVQREAQLVVERHARRRQGGHEWSLGLFAWTAAVPASRALTPDTRRVERNRLNYVVVAPGDIPRGRHRPAAHQPR